MKTLETTSLQATKSSNKNNKFTVSPEGMPVVGIGGAYIHRSKETFIPSADDDAAEKFLLTLVSIRAKIHENSQTNHIQPIPHMPLPKDRLRKSKMENVDWLSNAVMGMGQDVDLVDLEQSAALLDKQSTLAVELLTTTAGCIIAVAPDHIGSEHDEAGMNTVKRMLSASTAGAIAISKASVSIIEPHNVYSAQTAPGYEQLYLAA